MMRWVPYQAPKTMIRKPSKRGVRRRRRRANSSTHVSSRSYRAVWWTMVPGEHGDAVSTEAGGHS